MTRSARPPSIDRVGRDRSVQDAAELPGLDRRPAGRVDSGPPTRLTPGPATDWALTHATLARSQLIKRR